VLVADGKEVPCSVPVSDWFAHGMAFCKLPRRRTTSKIVLHWTGGTGDAQRVFDSLTERGLSAHFFIDAAGKVWQYCDAHALCSHAGRLDDGVTSANIDTVGIEIANHARETQRGIERPMTAERINGRQMLHADFLPSQVEAAVALCRALCDAYQLPMAAPTKHRDGDAILDRAMLRPQWERFRGVVGHLHARSTKSDPGLSILHAVHLAGR
jgi:N-acetyl-anhydromuramyl-L-alanine amidase AmpD